MADAAVPVLLEAVEKDDDKEAVSVAIAAAAGVLRGTGGEPARNYARQLSDAVGKVRQLHDWTFPSPCATFITPSSSGDSLTALQHGAASSTAVWSGSSGTERAGCA